MKNIARRTKLFVLIAIQVTFFTQALGYADQKTGLRGAAKNVRVVNIKKQPAIYKKSFEKRKLAKVERKMILDFTKL